MEAVGRNNMSSNNFNTGKPVQPHDLLQVNIENPSGETFRPQIPVPPPAYHTPSYLDSSNFNNILLYGSSYNASSNVERFPFFGHQYLHSSSNSSPTNSSTTTSSITPPAVGLVPEKSEDKKVHQIARTNESEQQKDIRRQKNREINRRRRASLKESAIAIEQECNRELSHQKRVSLKETDTVSTEQSRNRLRQRIKREINRMLRTGEKREDFLKETFAEVRIFFSDEEYNLLHQRVHQTIDCINGRSPASLNDTGTSTEQSRNRLRQRIKREISRMLQTGQKRDDFLKETFDEVRIFFSDQEYNSLYKRVLEIIDHINGRSPATLKETCISTEQPRNRLRQRINREISRMLRTNQKREDFLKETFAEVRIFFNDDEYNALYQRVVEVINHINGRSPDSVKEIVASTEQSRNRLRQRIKREISRMLRTGQKRESFLNETFDEVRIFFSDEEYNSLYQHVIEIGDNINGRSPALLKEAGTSAEQSRNRLRQRIKREISRMVRTGQRREDFLKETFAEIRIFFSEEECNSLYQRVLEATGSIQQISNTLT